MIKGTQLFLRAYPLARKHVRGQAGESHPGDVKHLIAYNRTVTELKRGGFKPDQITGGVIHLAVALAYLRS